MVKKSSILSFCLAAVDLLEGSGSKSQETAITSISRWCSFISKYIKSNSIGSSCIKIACLVIYSSHSVLHGRCRQICVFSASTSMKVLDPQHRN